jgi:predicted ATPase
MNTFIVISGCSGDSKSTLLAELARRGFATVVEPGRRWPRAAT